MKPPSHEALAALEEKYRRLVALREARAAGGEAAGRDELSALARRFPGALRELDTLPEEVLRARVEGLRAARAGERHEPWVAWLADYHALMRATLSLKARLRARKDLDDPTARREAAAVSAQSGFDLDAEYAHAVARPPQGRLGVVVFDALSRRHGVDRDALWQALFPTRRADRFTPGAPA
ncbi:MAG: hypothetical protein R3A52_14150 [Polyangiales bacterium]